MSTAAELGLVVDDAVVLSDSNRMVIRLTPCDVVARVAATGYGVFSAAVGAAREVEIVRRLDAAGAPVAALDPRVDPRVYVRDGFDIALWTYYEPVPSPAVAPTDYAHALVCLHDVMRQAEVTTPHFTDRVVDTKRWVAERDLTPDLTDDDRGLLALTLENLRLSIVDRGAAEQLLHGEPHPWNLLNTQSGLRFVDFENCVRGPVEFDLAWVPGEVSRSYPGADGDLVDECRGVVLALIAAHRWHRDDNHPSGRPSGIAFLHAVRAGPPWPPLDSV